MDVVGAQITRQRGPRRIQRRLAHPVPILHSHRTILLNRARERLRIDALRTVKFYSKEPALQPGKPWSIVRKSAQLWDAFALARGPAEEAMQAGLAQNPEGPEAPATAHKSFSKSSAYDETGTHQPAARAPIPTRPHLAAQQHNLHSHSTPPLDASAQQQAIHLSCIASTALLGAQGKTRGVAPRPSVGYHNFLQTLQRTEGCT